MSYIPDYRNETDKLNETDKAYINGYRSAVNDVLCFFDNLPSDMLSIEEEIAERIKERIEGWMEIEEIEVVCSLFDNADYLPDDIELNDANKL